MSYSEEMWLRGAFWGWLIGMVLGGFLATVIF